MTMQQEIVRLSPIIVDRTNPKAVIVPLRDLELLAAVDAGCGRVLNKIYNKHQTGREYMHKWNRGQTTLFDDFAQMIGGTIGECATGKYLNLYFGDNTNSDIGNDVEVRATDKMSNCLMLHDEDKNHRPYVMAVVNKDLPNVHLRGWMWARDGKDREKYWRDPTGKGRFAYFIPQSDLYAMHELLDLVKRGLVT